MRHKKTEQRGPAHLNKSIAEAARKLVELVREHINSNGRVSFDLVHHITIDHSFVSVTFVDFDGFLDLVEWRKRSWWSSRQPMRALRRVDTVSNTLSLAVLNTTAAPPMGWLPIFASGAKALFARTDIALNDALETSSRSCCRSCLAPTRQNSCWRGTWSTSSSPSAMRRRTATQLDL